MWKSYWEALKYLKKLNRVGSSCKRTKTLIHVSIIALNIRYIMKLTAVLLKNLRNSCKVNFERCFIRGSVMVEV
jgi:hypothetical protein